MTEAPVSQRGPEERRADERAEERSEIRSAVSRFLLAGMVSLALVN